MKRLSAKTRVLVADGAHALVLRNDGDAQSPNLRLVRAYEQDNPATRDQGADKPTRTQDSFGRRSSIETTDWHRVAEDRFVHQIAEDMAADLARGEFEDFILVAPPIALGEFRKASNAALAKATTLEIHKDLTKHPLDEVEKIITKALADEGFKA